MNTLSESMPRPIVCYGGTFDPVHKGHLAVARAVHDALDTPVHLLPAADPPHKGPTHANAEQRASMLALAIAGEPGLQLDRRELHREGPSYTIDTLRELRAELGPDTPIIWMIGSDSLVELDTWRCWRELFDYAHILAVQRPGSLTDGDSLAGRAPAVYAEIAPRQRRPSQLQDSAAGGFAIFPLAEQRPESSTELRRRLREGEPWRDWVPVQVADYIDQHDLYRGRGVHTASL